MYSIDAEAYPVGFAKFSAVGLGSDVTLATATPTAGITPTKNVDSMLLIVQGTKCYVNFGAAATANTLELPVGTYNFVNCRSIIESMHLLQSDASTTVNILYSSVNGR